MNRVFKLKASIALFAIILFQAELRAQSVSKADTSHIPATIDTNLTKKASSSILVKADTALIVKAGATIVQKADTTMVINADPELIRQFNAIVAARQKQVDASKPNNNTPVTADSASKVNIPAQSAANTLPVNTKPDGAAPAQVFQAAPPAVNAGGPAATTIVPAASTVISGPKTDASMPAPANSNNTTSAADNTQTAKNDVIQQTPVTDNAQSAKNDAGQQTPVNSDNNAQPAKNDAVQQTAVNTEQQVRKDAALQPPANTEQQIRKDPASQPPANTEQQVRKDLTSATNNAGTDTKKADSLKQFNSALSTGTDTTKAKKDTTLKSDTSKMKKDTALMVTDTTAQGVKAKAVFLEVGGAGLAISANYDSRFHDQRDGWGYHVGVGFFSSGGNTVFTIPFQINYLTGEHNLHMELGAGTTFMNSTGTNVGNSKWEFDKITGFIATATIGFRYQPVHKGLNFRIEFTPILYDEGLIPAGGVSVGYTFK